MSRDVEACWVGESVADAAGRMRARHVGFLPVVDDEGVIVGTITDRDLALRVVAERFSPDMPVHLVMTPTPITCSAEDHLRYAEELMRRHHKSRIVCVDRAFRPVGVISLADLVTASGLGSAPSAV